MHHHVNANRAIQSKSCAANTLHEEEFPCSSLKTVPMYPKYSWCVLARRPRLQNSPRLLPSRRADWSIDDVNATCHRGERSTHDHSWRPLRCPGRLTRLSSSFQRQRQNPDLGQSPAKSKDECAPQCVGRRSLAGIDLNRSRLPERHAAPLRLPCRWLVPHCHLRGVDRSPASCPNRAL